MNKCYKNKTKILIFIDWFLPGTKSGGPVRSCANLIAHLGEEYEFLVVTRNSDYCETKPYANTKANAWNNFSHNTRIYYISNNNLNAKFLKELINSTDFDVAYINGIYSRYFSILPVYFLRNTDKPVIVAARGMLNSQAFSVKPIKKKAFISIMNLFRIYENVNFHATNEDEAAYIRSALKYYRKIKIAPNLPRKVKGKAFRERTSSGSKKFISVARVAREKGTLTTLNALLNLHSEEKLLYDIYGPIYDGNYWKECEQVIKKLPENIEVNYKGSIEGEKVPELLLNYQFFIMPSEGENFGHGILEALTAGLPIIISDNTPWKNLTDKEIGWDCSLGSNELTEALDDAITMDQETYTDWSRKAFEFAKEVCNDHKAIEASRALFS